MRSGPAGLRAWRVLWQQRETTENRLKNIEHTVVLVAGEVRLKLELVLLDVPSRAVENDFERLPVHFVSGHVIPLPYLIERVLRCHNCITCQQSDASRRIR